MFKQHLLVVQTTSTQTKPPKHKFLFSNHRDRDCVNVNRTNTNPAVKSFNITHSVLCNFMYEGQFSLLTATDKPNKATIENQILMTAYLSGKPIKQFNQYLLRSINFNCISDSSIPRLFIALMSKQVLELVCGNASICVCPFDNKL